VLTGIWHCRATAATGRMAGAKAAAKGIFGRLRTARRAATSRPVEKTFPVRCRTLVLSFVLGVRLEFQQRPSGEKPRERVTPMPAASDTKSSAFYELGELGELARAATTARNAGTAWVPRGPGRPGDDASDESLMGRVAQGDRRAIRLLFGRYQLRVYRFVLRLVGNSATAEDIVSEVFLELWRHAASFEGRARLSTWILAIARNRAVSVLRGRIDQPLEDTMAEAIPDRAFTAEETLDASQRAAVLRQCLERLSPAHREIIDLVYYHEKSVEEAAAIVGVTAATVKTRMFYARRRLAQCLRAAGLETVHA
jgi:RNA polymerase sigma-70 factor, ECF subfamily